MKFINYVLIPKYLKGDIPTNININLKNLDLMRFNLTTTKYGVFTDISYPLKSQVPPRKIYLGHSWQRVPNLLLYKDPPYCLTLLFSNFAQPPPRLPPTWFSLVL